MLFTESESQVGSRAGPAADAMQSREEAAAIGRPVKRQLPNADISTGSRFSILDSRFSKFDFVRL